MVQTLAANRANDAFDISSLPTRSGSAENFSDIHYLQLITELLPINPISISQQISRRRIKRKGFEYLMRRPFGRRMSRDVKVDDAASIMREDNKDKQNF